MLLHIQLKTQRSEVTRMCLLWAKNWCSCQFICSWSWEDRK